MTMVATPATAPEDAWVVARRRALAARFLLVDDAGTPEGFIPYTFSDYHPEPVHYFVAKKLMDFEIAVREMKSPRLMISMPPRSGKSEMASRRFPAWLLGRNPDWSVILTSYGAPLAEELSGDCRDVVQSEAFAEIFGRTATDDESEAVELSVARKGVQAWRIARRRGGMRAVGAGGAVTGRGAHVLIIDDPVKNRKEADSETVREDTWNWYRSTARTRMEPGGGILLLMTRWHYDDLAGRLLAQLGHDWEVINLQAFAPEDEPDPLGRAPGDALDPYRYPADVLRQIQVDIGSREFTSLYLGKPTDEEGAIFMRSWWRYEPIFRARPRVLYQFWDLAFGRGSENDYSVCTTWGIEPGPIYRLLDVYRARRTLEETKKAAVRLYQEWGKRYKDVWVRAVIVERKGQTNDVFLEFKRDTRLPILWYTPDRDKVQRANAVTPLVENGSVLLPDAAPWKEDFMDELSKFPAAKHDDQVDSFTMALICMAIRAPGRRVPLLRDFKVVM